MQQTWRWFGPNDPVTLADARQAGATGIVTALHQYPPGEVWPVEEILNRKRQIEAAGLEWAVVESVNVSEDIKKRTERWRRHIDAYNDTLRNLAACGIRTVCYNFMPVLDWLRTDLAWTLPDGSLSMRFDATAFAAFDLFLLKRPAAENEWPEDRKRKAHTAFLAMSEAQRHALTRTVIAGLPGTDEVYTIEYVRNALASYADYSSEDLRSNLGEFLRAVCPVAEEVGVRLCVHPDDPPRSVLGLPRVVSTAADFEYLVRQCPERANGITFCAGSLGVRADNELQQMAQKFASRVYFVHLRSTKREQDDPESFHEAPHLEGDVDMVPLVKEFVAEERRRKQQDPESSIPFRPDHGNSILTDIGRRFVPGYPAIGRLRGLAEIRGILHAVERFT